MTQTIQKIKGLTGFHLKIIALVLMFLDHIYYFFEFTGAVPVFLSQLGRMAGHLFLFMIIEGLVHTSNRRKYIGRIYIFSVCMGTVNLLIQLLGLSRGDGFYPQNNIYASFFLVLLMLTGYEWVREGKRLKGLLLMIAPFAVNILLILGANVFSGVAPEAAPMTAIILMMSILPSVFMSEGGIYFILGGLILYFFRKNRKAQVGIYVVYTLLWTLVRLPFLVEDFSLVTIFTQYYEWLGIFAGIFMLLYNGQRGRSMKMLFYVFYPAHVYILYTLSYIFYVLTA